MESAKTIAEHKSKDILYAVIDATNWSINEQQLLEFARTLEDKNKRLTTSDVFKILKHFEVKTKQMTIVTRTKEVDAKIKNRIRESDFIEKYVVDGRQFIVSNGRRTWALVAGQEHGPTRLRLSYALEVLSPGASNQSTEEETVEATE